MKADWSKAPEWANYWAVDDDGLAAWYARKPYFLFGSWDSSGDFEQSGFMDVAEGVDPSATLEMRPA